MAIAGMETPAVGTIQAILRFLFPETSAVVERRPVEPAPGPGGGAGPTPPENPIAAALRQALEAALREISSLAIGGAAVAGDVFGSLVQVLDASARGFGATVKIFLQRAGLHEVADGIDVSGDFLSFLGSLEDAIVDRRRLTAGPLSFEEVLVYADRLQGLRACVILGSLVFSIAIQGLSLGQMAGVPGVIIHIADSVVEEHARIVSTQLVRKAVGDVLTDGYKQVHRTALLSGGDAAKAYELGILEDPELVEALARDGFNDRAIQVKTSLARVARLERAGEVVTRTKKVSLAEARILRTAGLYSREEFVHALAAEGFDDATISKFVSLEERKVAKKPPPGA
jgi:hypothetical protein